MTAAAGFSLTVALAALAAAAPAGAKGAPYKALGTEPFWSLAIGTRTLSFEGMDTPTVRQRTPRAKKTRYGHVYWTRRIQVAIVRGQPCSDGMSDYIYRDDVKVTVDGNAYKGCGGPRHLPKGGNRP